MTLFSVALIVLALILVQGIGLYLIFKRKEQDEETSKDTSGLIILQNQIEKLERALDSRMSESSKQMHEQLRHQSGESSRLTGESMRLLTEMTEKLATVEEVGRSGAKFAEQLQSLQDILKNPKQRGILGEYYLETVLKNVMAPGQYQMQYGFANGEIVDAVVFVKDKIVPIDSKFSLENYNRFIGAPLGSTERDTAEKAFVSDLKNRISETAKYIRPEENTMDFAFMFIPSEGIYYDLLVNSVGIGTATSADSGETENLIQRAASKYKVIIVSPTSFLAYLQTVLQGLKALQIEQSAKEIQKRVGELGKHIGEYESYYKKLGNALGVAVSHYNSGYKELGKIDKDVYRITGEKAGLETLALDKPGVEEDTI